MVDRPAPSDRPARGQPRRYRTHQTRQRTRFRGDARELPAGLAGIGVIVTGHATGCDELAFRFGSPIRLGDWSPCRPPARPRNRHPLQPRADPFRLAGRLVQRHRPDRVSPLGRSHHRNRLHQGLGRPFVGIENRSALLRSRLPAYRRRASPGRPVHPAPPATGHAAALLSRRTVSRQSRPQS